MIDLGGDVCGNGISKLVFTILSAVAENERERIRERIRDVKRHLAAQGVYNGGKRPFGFDVVDKRLVPNAAEPGPSTGTTTLSAPVRPRRTCPRREPTSSPWRLLTQRRGHSVPEQTWRANSRSAARTARARPCASRCVAPRGRYHLRAQGRAELPDLAVQHSGVPAMGSQKLDAGEWRGQSSPERGMADTARVGDLVRPRRSPATSDDALHPRGDHDGGDRGRSGEAVTAGELDWNWPLARPLRSSLGAARLVDCPPDCTQLVVDRDAIPGLLGMESDTLRRVLLQKALKGLADRQRRRSEARRVHGSRRVAGAAPGVLSSHLRPT